jgi:uncharacterized protein YgiM (DUF1202 family)
VKAIRTGLLLALALLTSQNVEARRELLKVVVAEPYIEMRTGPGRGYPIFHVADRGATIEVVRRRTDWFQVRTERGAKGWVQAEQLARTLNENGSPVQVATSDWDDFAGRRWEASIAFGDFDGASSITATAAYRLSTHLSAELGAAQISGEFSDGWLAAVRIVHTPFPEWRVSPFLMLGTGVLNVSPRASLVSTEDRTDQIAQAGIGVRAYITDRFVFRAEYSGYSVFTSRDDNEEVEEWKAGIAFYF